MLHWRKAWNYSIREKENEDKLDSLCWTVHTLCRWIPYAFSDADSLKHYRKSIIVVRARTNDREFFTWIVDPPLKFYFADITTLTTRSGTLYDNKKICVRYIRFLRDEWKRIILDNVKGQVKTTAMRQTTDNCEYLLLFLILRNGA